MGKLLVHLKKYMKETVLGPLLKLLEALLDLVVPLIIARIIDVGIVGADVGYIGKMCALLVALGLVGLGFSVTAQYFSAKAAVGLVTDLRHKLFKHINAFSFAQADAVGESTMITRMTSDMNQVQSGVNIALRLLLRSPFVVFGSVAMAFILDPELSAVFLCVVAALSIIIFGIMATCIPLYKKVQERLDSVMSKTRENLSGVRVLRAFCKEKEETREFESRNESLTSMQKFVGKISALMNPLTFVVVNLGVVWLLHSGSVRVDTGSLTQGEVVALYNYMAQISVELVKMAGVIVSITKSVASGNRIQAIFDIEPQKTEGTLELKEGGGDVEFKNVSLTYSGAEESALEDISFTAKKGETVGIIGGTGSGKSSLVSLIPGFYHATGGQVLVDGEDVRNYSLRGLRDKVGVVPQKAVLFSGTVRENILWGNKNASDKELIAALKIAQGEEFVLQKEGGLDFFVEQGGRNLSGGQKQRLTVARAVVKKPEILILDDSASALDLATDAALRRELARLPWQPTIFVVSQRGAAVMNADKIIVLEDGKIAGMGTHSQLLNDCAVYREIFESQFEKEGA